MSARKKCVKHWKKYKERLFRGRFIMVIYSTVKKLYFQIDESVIIITNSKIKEFCAWIKLDGLEKYNFFMAVKRVRDAFKIV